MDISTYINYKNISQKVSKKQFKNQYSDEYKQCEYYDFLHDFYHKQCTFTYDIAYNIATECNFYSEYKRKISKSQYNRAKKSNWLSTFIWMDNDEETPNNDAQIYKIYMYLDKNNVFINYTSNSVNEIYNRHKTNTKMCLYFDLHIIKPIILKDKVSYNNLIKNIEYFIDYYNNQNFNIINIAHGWYLSYNICVEKAKTCKNISEYSQKYLNEYMYAYKHKFVHLLFPNTITKGFWTYERCQNVAKYCKNITEFSKNYKGAYKASKRNNWLYDLFNNRFYLTYNYCYNIAKKCKTYSEFNALYTSVYEKSRIKGWLDNFIWLINDYEEIDKTLKIYYIYAYIWENEHVVYIGLTRHPRTRDKNHRGKCAYSAVKNYAHAHNIEIPKMTILLSQLNVTDAQYYEHFYINEYKNNGYLTLNVAATGIGIGSIGGKHKKNIKDTTIHKSNRIYYTFEQCYNIVQQYKTVMTLYTNNIQLYNYCYRKKWLNNMGLIQDKISKRRKWTYDECYNIAKMFTCSSELKKYNNTVYNVCRRNDYLKTFTWFKYRKTDWNNYNKCYNEALKYKSRAEFQKNSFGCYHKTLKNKWLDTFWWMHPTFKKCTDIIHNENIVNISILKEKYQKLYKFLFDNDWIKHLDIK